MKYLFIILLLCFSITSFAQDKLQLKSYLECGYYSGQLSWKGREINTVKTDLGFGGGYQTEVFIADRQQSTGSFFKRKMYSEMKFIAKWKGFSASTTFLTIIHPNTFYSYQPLQTYYTIGASYTYKFIMFNAEHMCTHSTETFMIGGGYTRVGARLYILNK